MVLQKGTYTLRPPHARKFHELQTKREHDRKDKLLKRKLRTLTEQLELPETQRKPNNGETNLGDRKGKRKPFVGETVLDERRSKKDSTPQTWGETWSDVKGWTGVGTKVLGPTSILPIIGTLVGGPVGLTAGLAGTAAVGARAYAAAKAASRRTYDKYYTKKDRIDFSRMDEVLTAGEFMLNSYNPEQEIQGWNYKWFHDRGEDVAFFAEHYNNETKRAQVVFSFRGTDSIPDMLQDAKSDHADTITEWEGFPLKVPVTAASGFLERVVRLGKAGLGGIVKKMISYNFEAHQTMYSGEGVIDDKPELIDDILITGHSLGGAAATIFAVILAQIVPHSLATKMRLITFEPARSLRASNINALMENPNVRDLAEHSIFITNGLDPVPQVPLGYGPELGPSGFKHFGTSWYITPEGIQSSFLSSHSSATVMKALKRMKEQNAPETDIYVSNGSGMKNRKKKKSSPAMKARMAYVRSFKGKGKITGMPAKKKLSKKKALKRGKTDIYGAGLWDFLTNLFSSSRPSLPSDLIMGAVPGYDIPTDTRAGRMLIVALWELSNTTPYGELEKYLDEARSMTFMQSIFEKIEKLIGQYITIPSYKESMLTILKWIKEIIKIVWKFLKPVFTTMWGWIPPAAQAVIITESILIFVILNWGTVKNLFTFAWDAGKVTFRVLYMLYKFFARGLTTMFNFLRSQNVKPFANSLWVIAKSFLAGLWEAIRTTGAGVRRLFVQLLSHIKKSNIVQDDHILGVERNLVAQEDKISEADRPEDSIEPIAMEDSQPNVTPPKQTPPKRVREEDTEPNGTPPEQTVPKRAREELEIEYPEDYTDQDETSKRISQLISETWHNASKI